MELLLDLFINFFWNYPIYQNLNYQCQLLIFQTKRYFRLTLFRIGGKKAYQFFPCNVYKRKNQPQKRSGFQFQPFCHTCVKVQGLNLRMSQIIVLEPRTPLRESWFFLSNTYEIEAMITSLIKMLELANFSHLTTFTILFEEHDKMWLVMSWTKQKS